MLAILITLGLGVYGIANLKEGGVSTLLICAVLIGAVWFIRAVWVEDDRAMVHLAQYWSMDGTERAKARRKWEAEAERGERNRIGRSEWVEMYRSGSARTEGPPRPSGKLCVCPKCGRYTRAAGGKVVIGGKEYTEYYCPNCRERNYTSI